MRLIFVLVLLAGVSLAGFAVFYAQERFAQYQQALAAERAAVIETTEVMVMTTRLSYGQELQPQHVRAIRWPAGHVPFGAFTSREQIFPQGAEGFRTVLRVMERDEPVLASKVTAPGEDAGVASQLAQGMRAFALTVDVASGVSGFLRPGDRVDVYWTGAAQGETVTRLIKSNVQIIAIDQITDEERNDPTIARTITVEAPPEDIAALAHAQSSGRLTLALVGVLDQTVSDTVEVNRAQLLGITEAVREAGPRVCTVRNRRGAEVIVIPVPCTD